VGSAYSGGERVQWWGARRRTAVYVPFSVYTMAWSGEHQAFVVEEFIKNGGLPVATQRAFRIRFVPGRRDTVPDSKMIYRWVSNFTQTGSALKQTSPGRPRSATGPENVAVIRASILKSPQRSARKHVAALRLSDRSVRRMVLIMCGFSKMAQQPIHLVVPFHFSEKCFLDMLSPCVVISGGRHIR